MSEEELLPVEEELVEVDGRKLKMARLHFEIPQLKSRQRVDRYITQHIKYATRNRVQQAIAEGRIKVNGKKVKNSYALIPGDQVEMRLLRPANEEMPAEDIPLDIVFEDEHLIVLNKPPGLAVHPTYRHWTGTLLNGLMHHFQRRGEQIKPGLSHRLDKFTSGIIVMGKTALAKRQLGLQFRRRSTSKVYFALVWGNPKENRGLIETNLGQSQRSRMVQEVFPYGGKQGKTARTAWQVRERFGRFALLEVELFTGRTHQIRAHLRHLGHPILGDFIYDGLEGLAPRAGDQDWLPQLQAQLDRQALHAAKLGIQHPETGENVVFEASMPEDMLRAMDWLRAQDWL